MKNTCTIYYNPKCGTCRDALELIEKKGVKPKIIEYLKTPPTEKDLDGLLNLLGVEPQAIVRTKDPLYQALGLDKKKLARSEWIKTLATHPILIQRPIVIKGKRAILGRPVERVMEIL